MTQPVNSKSVPRQAGVEAALRRAAAEARKLAARTNTPVLVLQHGQIVDLNQSRPKAS